MKYIDYPILIVIMSFLISCSPYSSVEQDKKSQNSNISTPNNNLNLEIAASSDDSLYTKMELGPFIFEANELKFIVQGKTLGTKTENSDSKKGRKSELGTYLHVVLNDTIHIRNSYRLIPYSLPDGNYKMLAFVSRSFDESVKLPSASYAKYFEVKSGRTVKSQQIDAVMLAINSPYGIYSKEEGAYVLLDFYMFNSSVGKSGNRLKVNIDNEIDFFIDEWKAYYIKGLGLGDHKISMELQNSLGQVIYGPVFETFVIEE